MKLNIGCGYSKIEGFLNLDKYDTCGPDQVMDAEHFPWPFPDNSVDVAWFDNSLEHMGGDPEVFLGIMRELYRVCRPGAQVHICVPHPRHDDFINDPTHVRAITPELLTLFSRRMNQKWRDEHAANTPFAFYLGVDFEVRNAERVLDGAYGEAFANGELTEQDLDRLGRTQNNVFTQYRIVLEALK